MRLTRVSMVVPLVIAGLTLVAPPAVADGAEDLGPPFLMAEGKLACNAAGGSYGSPSFGVAPRPPGVPTSRSDVRCSLTGTYASPVEALGSATVRARITRITATTD